MPRLTVDADDPRIAVVELGDARPAAADRRSPGTATATSSPAARAFVETALESCTLEYLVA